MEREIRERYEALKAMNEIIIGLNDETAYYDHWIYLIPDCAEDEDFAYIAEDIELFKDVCLCFRHCIKEYGKSGFFIGGILA